MNNQNAIHWNNHTNSNFGQNMTVEERNKKALALREMLGDTPTVALGQVLQLINCESVVDDGNDVAQLNAAVCHYAMQVREQLIAAQHELFVARQRAATEGEKLESMAQLLEQESRHKSQIAAELRAYKEHVAEIEALLEID